jgi:uncharacterized protein involved in outer membrane biogenesis
MNKTTKILLGLVGGVLAIAVIAAWLLASNLDGIVKQVVEEVGSETLGTKVSLSSAEISLQDAKAALNGLTIANPAGFKEPNAFKLGGIAVDLDAKSLTGDEVVMPSIIIDQAALTFEQSGTANNLQTLLDNMDSSGDDSSTGDGTGEAETETLIVIEELHLNAASMTLVSDQLSESLSLTLDNITVRNIGRRGAGVTPEEAADLIIKPILKQAETAAKNRVKDELKEYAKKKAEEEKGKFLDSAKRKLFGD